MRYQYTKEEVVAFVKELLTEYQSKITLRQIYYRLVAKEIFPNTNNSYKRLSKILVDSRRNGEIDPDIFEDRTRHSFVRFDHTISKEDYFNNELKDLKEELLNYTLPRWLNQPKKVFVVLEKQALENVFSEICTGLGITLVVNRGYNSYTQLVELADQITNDRENIFLLFGDFDPSGKDILRNFESQIKELGVAGQFIDVALNQDQITEFDLPAVPTKKTDTRSKKFVEGFGDAAVELDALDPKILQNLLKTNVDIHFDQTIYSQTLATQKEYREFFSDHLHSIFES